MKKLLLVVPFLFLGCVSEKTQAKIQSTVDEAIAQAKFACNLVNSSDRAKARAELAKCEKERKYWEDEFKELVTPK